MLDETPQGVSSGASERSFNIFVLHPSHFLTDHRPHGDGLLAFEFLSRLAQRGHNVHAAVSMRSIHSKLPAKLKLYDIETLSARSIDGGSALNRLEFSIRAGALFRRLSQSIDFDVVHQFNPVLYGLCFFAGLGKTPLVMGPIPPTWPRGTVHPDTFKRRLIDCVKAPMLQLQYCFACRILPASPALLNHPSIAGTSGEKAQVLSYGIDTQMFAPAEPDILPERPTVLFLANLWFGKGIFTLLNAFETVHRAIPEAVLIIAGKGTDELRIREKLKSHPARNNIRMIGNIDRANVPSVLRASTVYCLPSFGEPFGMTALEAMSCGRATVTTNTGGLAWLAPDDGTLRISPGDEQGLAESLIKLLADRSLAVMMGRRNREHVVRNFAWDVILSQLEKIYCDILSSSKHLSPEFAGRCTQPG
jgi:L-malate glycosyltransferase